MVKLNLVIAGSLLANHGIYVCHQSDFSKNGGQDVCVVCFLLDVCIICDGNPKKLVTCIIFHDYSQGKMSH